MLSNIQYDFLGHLHLLLHLTVTLSTHTHIVFHVVKESYFQNDKDCVGLSSMVFKICGQQSVNVCYNLWSEVRCMQSVICSRSY